MTKSLLIIFFLFFTMPLSADNYDVYATELPPLMYTENGTAKGFYTDLLEEMLTMLDNVSINLQFYPAPRMFMALSEKENSFSLGIARNEKRDHLYKWVGPIYPRVFSLYRLRSNNEIRIEKLEDVSSYIIGVGRGYAAMDDLLNAGVPGENIIELTTDAQIIKMLSINRP